MRREANAEAGSSSSSCARRPPSGCVRPSSPCSCSCSRSSISSSSSSSAAPGAIDAGLLLARAAPSASAWLKPCMLLLRDPAPCAARPVAPLRMLAARDAGSSASSTAAMGGERPARPRPSAPPDADDGSCSSGSSTSMASETLGDGSTCAAGTDAGAGSGSGRSISTSASRLAYVRHSGHEKPG